MQKTARLIRTLCNLILFVEDTKVKLGLKARGRNVVENNDVFELKEPIAPYNAHLHTENDLLSHGNMYYWEGSIINSTG